MGWHIYFFLSEKRNIYILPFLYLFIFFFFFLFLFIRFLK
jgi:hypothetical protein